MLPLEKLLSSIDRVWIGSAADYLYRVGVPVIRLGFGSPHLSLKLRYLVPLYRGGAVAQSGERATHGEEFLGSIPAVAARSLLVGSVSM